RMLGSRLEAGYLDVPQPPPGIPPRLRGPGTGGSLARIGQAPTSRQPITNRGPSLIARRPNEINLPLLEAAPLRITNFVAFPARFQSRYPPQVAWPVFRN